MRKRAIVTLTVAAAFAVAFAVAGLALAGGGGSGKAGLKSYAEVPTLATSGHGTLRFRIDRSAKTISYELEYSGLEGGAVSQAHIHLGRTAVNGGVIAFLCGGGDKPACPASGEVTGVIDANDIIGPAAQGIDPAEDDRFEEVVAAIHAKAVYANVHTATYGGGEIRGRLRAGDQGGRSNENGKKNDDEEDDDD